MSPSQLVQRADLSLFCKKLLAEFSSRQLILLKGDLGTGKTTLVQECARHLGFDGVESPTFSIVNEYPTRPKIYHVDLYRLETEADIESTGFWDLFTELSAYIFVEWPERVSHDQWPKSWQQITISLARGSSDDERVIQVIR